MSIRCLMLMLMLASVAAAQVEPGAKWVQVDIKLNFQQTSTGFCREQSQCLVSNAFSEVFDNIPESFWDGLTDSDLGPKCIGDGQFILDNYCARGGWSSRTRLIATELLAIALRDSPSNFSLYCDSFETALNEVNYLSQAGPVLNFLGKSCPQEGFAGARVTERCTNSLCVLKYGQNVAFGTSLNARIDGPKSFLNALNLGLEECGNALNSDGDYDYCGDAVWFNLNTNSILYAPGLAELGVPSDLANQFFLTPYNELSDYVFSVVHKPEVAQFNYTFFRQIPQFSQVYFAKDGFEFVYAFKQKNVTLSQIDYAGWYLSNIELPSDACTRFVKRFDSRANCESQPSPTEFFVVAHKTPQVVGKTPQNIVDSWHETTGRLRVVS
ncbi:hypothetical protein J4219_08415 [Candidatus Woesearchaeota archaeon]|nr:hypothetical protein [Candidatus Woesearchaeota archaeon]